MRELRAAVIGAGRLGTLHARKYAAIAGIKLAHIVDLDNDRGASVAAELGAAPLTDYRLLAGKVDLATVASPGVTHHEIASAMLKSGIDVLLEKPMAETLAQARELAGLASASGRILQIGHLERFNPAVVAARPLVTDPRFIEVHRLGTFLERSLDIDVVFDLMIHDLDVVLSLVNSDVQSLEAVGVPVVTSRVDIANARLRFANGCIANLTASRISRDRVRKIRFFQTAAYLSIDYAAQKVEVWRLGKGAGPAPTIEGGEIEVASEEPLKRELADFVDAVASRRAPAVTGDDGRRALALATEISNRIGDVNGR